MDLLDDLSRSVRDAALERLLEDGGCRLLTHDLLEGAPQLSDDYELIVHLAAIVGVPHVMERPYEVLTANARLLENVISIGRSQRKLERLVFASTSEVYAGTLEHFDLPIPTPESTPLALSDPHHRRTTYMLSKIYGELMCRFSGLPHTIVRPHNVYGPRMGLVHVIPELLQVAHGLTDGEKLRVYSVDHRRSFCYIDDAVEMLIRIVDREESSGRVLNLGREAPEVTMRQVGESVIRAVGRRLTIAPRPAAPGSVARRAPDMTLTASVTGYRAQVDLDEGIARTFEWYRDQVFEGEEASAR